MTTKGSPATVTKPLLHLPWPRSLVLGRLVRRYNRFLADIRLDDGAEVVAHCVNTGRMEGLVVPGARVWLSPADAPGRQLKWTWEIVEIDGVLVGANTALPNTLVRRLLEQRLLPGFKRWTTMRPEAKVSEGTRVDFLLEEGGRPHYIEVKNCHLVYPDGRGYFPDSVSERATKHLEELAEFARHGARATVIFTAQRADTRAIRPSDRHDPAFAAAARRAGAAGVRFMALRACPSPGGITIERTIPVDLGPYSLAPIGPWYEANRAASGWQQVRHAKDD